jgi:hypothetical protein
MRSRNLLAILRLSGGSRHRRGVQRRVEVGNYPAARPMDGARPLSFPQAGSQSHHLAPLRASTMNIGGRPRWPLRDVAAIGCAIRIETRHSPILQGLRGA